MGCFNNTASFSTLASSLGPVSSTPMWRTTAASSALACASWGANNASPCVLTSALILLLCEHCEHSNLLLDYCPKASQQSALRRAPVLQHKYTDGSLRRFLAMTPQLSLGSRRSVSWQRPQRRCPISKQGPLIKSQYRQIILIIIDYIIHYSIVHLPLV